MIFSIPAARSSRILMIYDPAPRPTRQTFTLLQFIFSAIAIIGILAGALLFGLTAVLAGISSGAPEIEVLTVLLISAGLVFCGVLVIPSAVYAYRRMSGKPHKGFIRVNTSLWPLLGILLLPIVILAGDWVSGQAKLAWLLLPPLHILAVGIPIVVVLFLAIRGLPLGSHQRTWGSVASGVVLGPTIVLILETMGLLFVAGLVVLFIFNKPDLFNQLSAQIQELSLGTGDPEQTLETFLPYLTQPGILLGGIAFISIFVPLVEEAFKPVAVWLLAGSKLTPAAGFAIGAICGAGFALFESLGLSSGGTDWAYLVSARLGTSVIHITNSALMGWALASTWRKKQYLQLAWVFLAVVAAHGAWNAISLLSASQAVLQEQGISSWLDNATWLGTLGPWVIGVMALGGLVLLIWFNARLRRQMSLSTPETFGAALPAAQE